MNYYLTSLRKKNYEILENNGFRLIGFNERSHLAEKLEPGDLIFVYIGSRVSKIAGYVIVNDKFYWDNELLWDDVFPKRVKIEPGVILKEKIDIRSLIDRLSFVKNKLRYGMSFLAGLREIPCDDGEILKKEIERRQINEL